MADQVTVALVGNYHKKVVAHQAVPLALQMAGEFLGRPVAFEWVPTETISSPDRISQFGAIWCVPGSPYRSMDGALTAIRWAREQGVPFLGTCGGFQHAVVEFARNVRGWADAEHAETAPQATRAVIAPLACALVEQHGRVQFAAASRIAAAYGVAEAVEGYHCRYGFNPDYSTELLAGPLRAVAHDDSGAVRAVELEGHEFFVATLFQPERAALGGNRVPLVEALIRHARAPR
jgi:CTP synthase (UTP-ammonia lyase)